MAVGCEMWIDLQYSAISVILTPKVIFAHHYLSIHVVPSKLSGLCSCVFDLYNETKFRARVSKLPIPQRSEQTRRENAPDQSY